MNSILQMMFAVVVVTGVLLGGIGLSALFERMSQLELHLVNLQTTRDNPASPVQPEASVTDSGNWTASVRSGPTAPREPSPEATPAITEATDNKSVATSNPAQKEESTSSELAETFINRGYAYAHEFDAIGPELASLTQQENRNFWIQMNQALEEGSIDILEDSTE